MDNRSESSDTVILVLGDHRLEANKKQLASNSQYFACLFSVNFSEHLKTEFPIEYDISLETLQGFVDWVNDEEKYCNSVYPSTHEFIVQKSLEKFLTGNYSDLFELLRLSVIFVAEKLTEHVTEVISIICVRLSPDDILETWKLAEFYDLKVLKRVALTVCLEKFNEISIASLVELSFENFSKLVRNVNANCTSEQLMDIRRAWIEGNSVPPNLDDSSKRFIEGRPEDVLRAMEKGRETRCLQCIAAQDQTNGTQFIYTWNGETLGKLGELPREILGSRFFGKGFFIYVVGRRMGEHSADFNTTIWRYCFINKKWAVETKLPRHREAMQAVPLENKLYLFGGTGCNGQVCSTTQHRDICSLLHVYEPCSAMDVYDFKTGVWSKAMEAPTSRVSPSQPLGSACVGDGKIFYQRDSMLHIYDPLIDVWSGYFILGQPGKITLYQGSDFTFYVLGVCKQPNFNTLSLFAICHWNIKGDDDATMGIYTIGHRSCGFISLVNSWPSVKFYQQILNEPQLVRFIYHGGCVVVEEGEVNMSTELPYAANYTFVRSDTTGVPENPLTDLGCFNLKDPNTLEKTITMPEPGKIGERSIIPAVKTPKK